MGKRKAPKHDEVLRARRFELVDDDGEVRAVLGQQGTAYGLTLYGEDPVQGQRSLHRRADFAVGHAGPWMEMSLGGNTSLSMGVHDPIAENFYPGPYWVLCDQEGATALEARTDLDGTWTLGPDPRALPRARRSWWLPRLLRHVLS